MEIFLRSELELAVTEYGAVLLDLRDGQYWQLSRTAARVVQALRDGRGRDGAVADLTSHFDVAVERARQDVDTLLDELRSAGLAVR
ncbi:lasso peptide biosynthesis PqqD family chaperone [Micromonospora carbonacea]|uniref:lasso peptide biosynthesis PqqD family chaperone n=1 Tax=Micromonospora carbonacea TaxID=47853 RepID=UPI0018256CF7|nr:lasso peptide biosynthesis PqqD family chaperone [Micromonospora carbonacea]MBB5830023.1 site-specific recombinase [Micromonospora carbonacea]